MNATASIRLPRRRSRTGLQSYLVCAHLAWISPVVLVLLTAALHFRPLHLDPAAIPALGERFTLAAMFVSLAAGVTALFGIRRCGPPAILIPLVAGFAVWVGLMTLLLPSIRRARQLIRQVRVAHPAEGLRPAAHTAGAERIRDELLDFSLDLPAGFTAFPPDKTVPGYRYAYYKPAPPGESADLLLVKNLLHFLQPKHLTAASLPPGRSLSVETFDWRGLAIDVVRMPLEKAGKPYLEYDVQVPLKRGAIQIAFGGPAADEAALRQRISQTLATLDGETNW